MLVQPKTANFLHVKSKKQEKIRLKKITLIIYSFDLQKSLLFISRSISLGLVKSAHMSLLSSIYWNKMAVRVPAVLPHYERLDSWWADGTSHGRLCLTNTVFHDQTGSLSWSVCLKRCLVPREELLMYVIFAVIWSAFSFTEIFWK